MLRILLTWLIFSFVFQSAHAAKPEPEEPEPEFTEDAPVKDAPKWACPSSIRVDGIEYDKLPGVAVFDGPPENLARLAPEPRRYIAHRFLSGENIYLSCGYAGLETRLIIHAKGATFCGTGGNDTSPVYGCWTGPSP
ncbi:MAG: hypothetical protein LBU45_09020 [Azoarcus sp.]|nr:hypothetical protein [Azoarcus sp.]